METPKPSQVEFSSQNDPKYKFVQEHGIETAGANFCWLACVDMAVSKFTDPQTKERFIKDFVGELSKKSDFYQGRVAILTPDNAYVDTINEVAQSLGINMEATRIENVTYNDFENELNAGAVVMYDVMEQPRDQTEEEAAFPQPATTHVMLMEEIVFQEGDYVVFRTIDPAAPDANSARFLRSKHELYMINNFKSGLSLGPIFISFKPKAKPAEEQPVIQAQI